MPNVIFGVDAVRNSAGELIQIGELGFGASNDYEVIQRVTVDTAVADVELLFDPSLYEEYELSILSLVGSADTGFGIRTSSNSGASYDAGGTDYDYVMSRVSHTTSEFLARVGDDADTRILFGDALGTAANEHSTWKCWFGEMDNSLHKYFFWRGGGRISDANGYSYWGGGQRESTADINAIQCRFDSGNIEQGVFVLRGRRKVQQHFVSQDDWVVLSEKEASASANISFEPADFNIADYDQFEIEIIDAVGASDGADLRLTVSDDGGATYEATSYHYTNHRWGSIAGDFHTGATAGTHGQLARAIGNGTGEAFNGTIKVNALDQTSTYKVFKTDLNTWGSGSNEIFKWDGIVSWNGATNAIDGIRFTMDNAGAQNITSGKFRLRGRRKVPLGTAVQRWQEATLQTTDATLTSIVDIPIALDTAVVVRGFGTVTEPSTANQFSFNFVAHGKNNGGTSAEGAGSPVIDKIDSDGGNTWDFDVDVDDTTDTIRLRATGEAATTLDWKVQYEVITEDNS